MKKYRCKSGDEVFAEIKPDYEVDKYAFMFGYMSMGIESFMNAAGDSDDLEKIRRAIDFYLKEYVKKSEK